MSRVVHMIVVCACITQAGRFKCISWWPSRQSHRGCGFCWHTAFGQQHTASGQRRLAVWRRQLPSVDASREHQLSMMLRWHMRSLIRSKQVVPANKHLEGTHLDSLALEHASEFANVTISAMP